MYWSFDLEQQLLLSRARDLPVSHFLSDWLDGAVCFPDNLWDLFLHLCKQKFIHLSMICTVYKLCLSPSRLPKGKSVVACSNIYLQVTSYWPSGLKQFMLVSLSAIINNS